MRPFLNIWQRIRDIYGRRYDPEGARTFADAYWRALLVLALCILVAVSFYAQQQFYATLNDISDVPEGGISVSALDRKYLDATVSGITARQAAFNTFGAHPPAVPPDPSK